MGTWNDLLRRELSAYISAAWVPEEVGAAAYVEECELSAPDALEIRPRASAKARTAPGRRAARGKDMAASAAAARPAPPAPLRSFLCDEPQDELARRLSQLDEGFSQTLLRLIDEKGLTDAECYRRAGVDRRHFSKIRSDPDYRPGKGTAAAFAFALGLTLDETQALLAKAGYALSHASKFDVILEYFLIRGVTDVDTVNAALFEFDQPLLGAK